MQNNESYVFAYSKIEEEFSDFLKESCADISSLYEFNREQASFFLLRKIVIAIDVCVKLEAKLNFSFDSIDNIFETYISDNLRTFFKSKYELDILPSLLTRSIESEKLLMSTLEKLNVSYPNVHSAHLWSIEDFSKHLDIETYTLETNQGNICQTCFIENKMFESNTMLATYMLCTFKEKTKRAGVTEYSVTPAL